MIAESSLRSSARRMTLVAGALVAASCMRAPEPSPVAATFASPRAQSPRVAPSNHHAVHEQKPTAGTQVEVHVAPTQSDVATVTITVTATRPVRDAKLRVGTELPTRVEGEAEWTLDPLAAGQSITRTVTVRRTQPSTFGSLVTASVSIDQPGSRVSDVAAAWAFGDPNPERVLPQSGATLGENGVGQLGPNDRVIRTPEGVRLHESIVP